MDFIPSRLFAIGNFRSELDEYKEDPWGHSFWDGLLVLCTSRRHVNQVQYFRDSASKQFGQTNPISFLGGSSTHRASLGRFPFEELPRGFKEIGAAMLAEQPNC